MQDDLLKAAIWYIEKFDADIGSLITDLKDAKRIRSWALYKGNIEQIERTFATVEILKAAICLTADKPYETDFCPYNLGLIRKYSYQGPKLFTCRKCGNVYPASAFKTEKITGKQSHFCIACEKEIHRVYQQYAKPSKGYIDRKGAIVCTAA